MKTICVAGTRSGAGKTAVAEMLLRKLKGWTAAKISPGHAQGARAFGIETRRGVIGEPGTDTARFLQAGAGRVFWVWARRSAMKAAMSELLGRLRAGENLIVEGNSFARAHRPDVTIMVAEAGRRDMKSSATAILRKVDVVVLRADPEDSARCARRAAQWWKGRAGVEDVFVVRSFRRGNAALVRCVRKRLRQARNEERC